MKYTKPPLSFTQQLNTLKQRGLIIPDEGKALHYLSNISFYRLRAYTYPFQDNVNRMHPFKHPVSFDEIIALYVFDRRLRVLVFNALEKLEIAFRTKIIYHFSMESGSQFYENKTLFRDQLKFRTELYKLQVEMKRSSEDFIKHYFDKYTQPANPPAWMSLELASMGWLSQLYKNMHRSEAKKAIAADFGLPNVNFLENWLHVLTNLRNACAHHARIWNRRFVVKPKLPRDTTRIFLINQNIHINKLYALLCCIQYLLQQVSPMSSFSSQIKQLIEENTDQRLKDMGFPDDWTEEQLWKE